MIEIRIHGRGGQGAVTASELLAVSAFKDGKFSQAFPSFGPERTGAPVEAYCRIDDRFISIRTHVYEPDYLLVLDESLLSVVDITNGLKKNGIIIINSEKKPDLKFKTYTINATKIALDLLGRPIVNTAMLGSFAKASKLISLKSIEEAIKERFSPDLAKKNIEAIKRAYNETKI
jgi:pyruvate ferredoxin oxidoreductase gamma subunit